MLSSCANSQGHGGVQLWISKRSLIDADQFEIATDHLRVVHSDPRRLVVQLRHPRLRLLFIVLHAPCQDDEAAMTSWWKETSKCIPSSCSSWSWILLGDTNGRVGSVTSRAIGNHGAEPENMRGSLLHDWLIEHNMWLPQTFEGTHSGEHSTWHHPTHGQGRIDFVGLSSDICAQEASTWVHADIDLSTVRIDHACVCAEVWLHLDHIAAAVSHVAPQVPAPLPTWRDDVHTHAALLQRRLQDQAPLPQQRVMRKRHLSIDTIALIKRKKFARRRDLAAQRAQRRSTLTEFFYAWKGQHVPSSIERVSHAALMRNAAFSAALYRKISIRVSHCVRDDDRHFFEELAEETGRVADRGFHRVAQSAQA